MPLVQKSGIFMTIVLMTVGTVNLRDKQHGRENVSWHLWRQFKCISVNEATILIL
jgi:hypothetical protein